jgi:hypothetical protein
MRCNNSSRLCSAFNAHIDFAAERPEVDWLGKQCLSTVFQRLAFRLRIALGGDQDDRDFRPKGLRLGQEFKPVHPRHIDVGQDQNERPVACIGDALKSHRGGLCKLHREAVGPEIAPELLAKQNLHIGLIINHETDSHAFSWLDKGRPRTRQNDPEFSELTGLRIDLYRPAVLLDDDVVTNGQTKPSPFTGRLCRKERAE